MHDLVAWPWHLQSWPEVTGDTSGHDALDAEDEVLRILYVLRRQMAEGVLHQTKASEGFLSRRKTA